MDNLSSKISIGLLEGKSNWSTWKYKILVLLRNVDRALDVIEGRFTKPLSPIQGSGDAAVAAHTAALQAFDRADTNALLLVTTNLSEDTLKKVMRYTTSREVWLELHRLYDGVSEDRSYNLCMQFFGFKRDTNDDIATHLSKLKNIWTQLNLEMTSERHSDLPDLLLVCKILDTLGEDYFSFRSSWLLMPKTERTVENLTSHLCAFENALSSKTVQDLDVLFVNTSTQKYKKDVKMRCNYCLETGHRVKNCPKWLNDGKPPKSKNPTPSSKHTASNRSNNANLVTQALMYTESLHTFTVSEYDRNGWWIDNGATSHITNRSDLFQTFENFVETCTIVTANGQRINAKGKGCIVIKANVNGKTVPITLQDVWYVPSIQRNLFSVLAAHDKNPNSTFSSTPRHCSMSINGEIKVKGSRCLVGGLYKLDVENVIPNKRPEIFLATETQLYHERLAHQNKRHVRAFVKREFGIDLPPDHDLCEGCVNGKAHRLKFGTRARASTPGEIFHTDLCGPFPPSFSKYRYFLLFKDDYTKFRSIYLLKQKSEVSTKLKLFLAEVKNAGHTVNELLSDNGREFDNHIVKSILQKEGIRQRLVCPYTPEQNGCVERENRTVVEAARTMLHAHKELPQELWAEFVNTAVYILNRSGPTPVEGKSPFELWYGKKASTKHLRIIGSTCYAHVPKQKRRKLDKKATKGILIGYDTDGYRIWAKQGKKNILIRSRDVIFEERPLASVEGNLEEEQGDTTNDEKNHFEVSLPRPPVTSSNMEGLRPAPCYSRDDIVIRQREGDNILHDAPTTSNNDHYHPIDEPHPIEIEGEEAHDEHVEPSPMNELYDSDESDSGLRYSLRDRANLKPPARFEDYIMAALTYETQEPLTYAEAIQSGDSEKWLEAMKSEIDSLHENRTWTLQELPKGRKAIPCKWVFKIKRNPNGSIDKYKARLVVKGYNQKKGIDYAETFSPVARMATIRAMISVAANENMLLRQFDVTTAFLHGHLQEEIFMRQPEGFEDGTGKVCSLNRSLYGLKQAPRCWNMKFHQVLMELQFKQSTADPCLYTKKVGEEKILLTLFVDDGLVAGSKKNLLDEFLRQLQEKLKITTKPATFYLGIEISQVNNSIIIKQEAYTKKLLERFGMKDCNPITTPIEKESFESGNTSTDDEEKPPFPYREAVGALAYLMVATRPDIAYAVGVVSRKLESPTRDDWLKVKRIMRYVKGTSSFGIRYKAGHLSGYLEGFSDADHGGDLSTGRSTTGVVCRYAGGAIAWMSQRQISVAISTTEAELVAASEGARELVWLTRVLKDMTVLKCTPVLSVDNEAAVRLAHNPEFHKRTKHIRIRHFYVRELVAEEEIVVKRVSTNSQVADIMTKSLARPVFYPLREELGLRNA